MIPAAAITDALDQANMREIERAFRALVDFAHYKEVGGIITAATSEPHRAIWCGLPGCYCPRMGSKGADVTRRDLLRTIRGRLPSAEQQFPWLVTAALALGIGVLWLWGLEISHRWIRREVRMVRLGRHRRPELIPVALQSSDAPL